MVLKVVKLDPNAELPIRAHINDAGADVKAVGRKFLNKRREVTDNFTDAVQVRYDLGIGVEVPSGYMLIVACKSSVYKTGMDLANSIGVVDFGYQGRIFVTFNLNKHSKPYLEGDAVCQLILVPIETPSFEWGEFTTETDRGTGGHGSTGNLFEKQQARIEFTFPNGKKRVSSIPYESKEDAHKEIIEVLKFEELADGIYSDGETTITILK